MHSKILALLTTFFILTLSAEDFNKTYFEGSLNLIKNTHSFKKETYRLNIDEFKEEKNFKKYLPALKNNPIFFEKQSDLFLKVRSQNLFGEALAWEISFLLELPDIIPPSYPLEIDHQIITLQKRVSIVQGSGRYELPKNADKVTLENYWKSHLFIFLLGRKYIKAENIGVRENGSLCFFDFPKIFYNFETPPKSDINGIDFPFCSVAFDMPQYFQKLDLQSAEELKRWAARILNKTNELETYGKIRGISTEISSLIKRIKIIHNFDFKNKSFFNFISYLYPTSAAGLDELSKFVSKIEGKKLGHGSALFFFAPRKKLLHTLPKEKQQFIKSWKNKYID